MSRFLLIAILLISLNSNAQSVFGYWYGYANVKSSNAANNYLVELILNPEKGYVSGVLNYYFRNSYRSLKVQGNYDVRTRTLSMYDIPLTYFGSRSNFEVDCMMNMRGTLRISKSDSVLIGNFTSLPKYKYTCPDVSFNLTFNADISKRDSVLNAIRNFKETNQLWQPSAFDTLPAIAVVPHKVINYVLDKAMPERQVEIAKDLEVESDTVEVDFYDNGEVDGDSIAVFFNKQLVAYHLKLSSRSIHFVFTLDKTKDSNELMMFAENLGGIPPNTALMIVDDGKNKHQIRLSSSLEKSAAIRISRKKQKK
jgi:archaellum component FlaF (FlaF/FlaG flagellin family)